jgi:predicted PurR-regulated permease PerM
MDNHVTAVISEPTSRGSNDSFISQFPAVAKSRAPATLTGIFVLLLFYTFYFASAVLIPIAVAFLLSVLLSPFVDRLERLGLPRVAGAAAVMIVTFGTIFAGLVSVAAPAQEWVAKVPESFKKVDQKLRSLKKPLQDFSEGDAAD